MERPDELPNQYNLPHSFRLLPGEHVLKVISHPKSDIGNSKVPSSLEQMMRLTQVTSSSKIGHLGPAKAALSFQDSAPEHLNLYSTLFGRDSLRVAIDLVSTYPELARSTVLELARQQGLEYNYEREEEVGRIVHEVRSPDDPIAQALSRDRGWGWPYYGSVDATVEFVRTLTAYCQVSEENRAFLAETYIDKNGQEQTMSRSLELALSWMLKRQDANPEGLIEYHTDLPHGIENQVWKDSWDAYHHSDGTIANLDKGIASIEVQVSTFDALIDAAELYEDILDQPDKAQDLRRRAVQLKSVIFDKFWTDEQGGFFVLGTDRDENDNLRQLKIRTSNMGHTLNSRLLKGDDPTVVSMRDKTIAQLMSPEMLNISGIRTLATNERRFRPGAYHNGSVWLWDTHHIAKGLRRLGRSESNPGYRDKADELDRRILNVINQTRMFPEYVRGDDSPIPSVNTGTIVIWDSIYKRENKVEQPPQEVQAWTVAAVLATKRRIERHQFI